MALPRMDRRVRLWMQPVRLHLPMLGGTTLQTPAFTPSNPPPPPARLRSLATAPVWARSLVVNPSVCWNPCPGVSWARRPWRPASSAAPGCIPPARNCGPPAPRPEHETCKLHVPARGASAQPVNAPGAPVDSPTWCPGGRASGNCRLGPTGSWRRAKQLLAVGTAGHAATSTRAPNGLFPSIITILCIYLAIALSRNPGCRDFPSSIDFRSRLGVHPAHHQVKLLC